MISVTVIVVENKDEAVCVSLCANVTGKGVNTSVLVSTAMN